MKRIIASAVTLCCLSSPVAAFEQKYEFKADRFDGTKTVSYATASGCRQTAGLKGSAKTCLVINSTESSRYPRLSVMKINDGWELLKLGRPSNAPVIVTYKNGSTKTYKLPAMLQTSVLHGSSVAEWVSIETKTIANQANIAHIEWQYGSAEFKFTPDRRFRCVSRMATSC
jgi:hypothetical protein